MNYIFPENVKNDKKLSSNQIKQWKENGYLLIDGLLEEDIFEKAKNKLYSLYPHYDSIDKTNTIANSQDFGSNGYLEFPCVYQEINDVTISNNIIYACEQLLDEEVRLLQSDAWSKYGGDKNSNPKNNRDQRIHVDYPNNTLVHPSSWDTPDAVAIIVYFNDHKKVGGGTAVVPKENTNDLNYKWPLIANPGVAGLPWLNDKESIEAILEKDYPDVYQFRKELYKKEKKVAYNPGTVLFYRHDIWHRGTPVNLGQVRHVINLGYRRESCDWLTTWNPGWARPMYHETFFLEKMIAQMTVKQRNILGFPKPGHKYWNQKTLEAVTKRYGPFGFDPKPYFMGLSKL